MAFVRLALAARHALVAAVSGHSPNGATDESRFSHRRPCADTCSPSPGRSASAPVSPSGTVFRPMVGARFVAARLRQSALRDPGCRKHSAIFRWNTNGHGSRITDGKSTGKANGVAVGEPMPAASGAMPRAGELDQADSGARKFARPTNAPRMRHIIEPK